MTRPEIILQKKAIPPTEEELRRDYLFFRIEVGTPWDHDGYIMERGMVPRTDFILSGNGSFAEAICQMAWAIENHIRSTLIPDAIAREEAKQRDAGANDPVDKV